MHRRTTRWPPAVAFAISLLLWAGCGGDVTPGEPGDDDGDGVSQAAGTGPRLVAVGDIACEAGTPATETTCRQADTAGLVRDLDPSVIAALGDMQYPSGTLKSYRASFDRVWHPLKARMRPTPGNHEYETPGAAGYFDYFGDRAGSGRRGWYSYDVGDWHVVSLNGNCDIVGCKPGSPQQRWLAADLAAHPARCTLAYWHQPRFSSGLHGDDPAVGPLWRTLQEADAELVLSGNDHAYERFEPQDADGREDERHGVVQFVVGTGGESHYAFRSAQPNSAAHGQAFGVLELTLGSDSYAWRFVGVPGSPRGDAGSTHCH